jgi:hypothetical protein
MVEHARVDTVTVLPCIVEKTNVFTNIVDAFTIGAFNVFPCAVEKFTLAAMMVDAVTVDNTLSVFTLMVLPIIEENPMNPP